MSTASDTTIADQIVLLQQQAAAYLPSEVQATFGAQVARLRAAGLPEGLAGPGVVMPDGDLLDAQGRPTTLGAARHGGPAVVVFYRGDWCPYCNLTLRAYQEMLLPALDALDVTLVAVSPQRPDGALSMQEKNELSFTVLSDPASQIGAQLGILMEQGEDVRSAQATLGLDVAATNADGTDALPMPTVVIVDAGGTIRWIDVHPDFTTRTEPADVLGVLADLEL